MKLYSLEEVTDELIGPKGSLEREKFDRQVKESLHTYRIEEAIKKTPQTKPHTGRIR